MIDITVGDDRTIEVEMKTYYLDYSKPSNLQSELILVIKDIINKAKYSGESITLSRVEGNTTITVEEW